MRGLSGLHLRSEGIHVAGFRFLDIRGTATIDPMGKYSLLACCLLFVLMGFCLFGATGVDDSHITFWAAKTFSELGKVLNYNYEPVEGSSSLLFVLLLGTLKMLLPFEIPSIAHAIGIAAGTLTIAKVFQLSKIYFGDVRILPVIAVSVSPYFIYWSFSGMETSLSALCLLLFLESFSIAWVGGKIEKLFLVYILMTLLVRPENPFLIIGFASTYILFALLGSKQLRKSRFELLGLIGFAVCLTFLARLIFFGSVFTQSTIAKSGTLSLEKIHSGLHYIYLHLTYSPATAAILFLGLTGLLVSSLRYKTLRPSALILSLSVSALLETLFVILSGGDWMEAGRFLVVLIPVAIILAFPLIKMIDNHKIFYSFAILLCLTLSIKDNAKLADEKSLGTAIWQPRMTLSGIAPNDLPFFERSKRTSLRDIPFLRDLSALVAKELDKRGSEPLLIMSRQAGFVMYYLKTRFGNRIRFIDLCGLTTNDLTSCSVSASLPRTSVGVCVHYDFVFEKMNAFQEHCNWKYPDIVFDLEKNTHPSKVVLKKYGYKIVIDQRGVVAGDSFPLGASLSADEFAAVRSDLN